MISLAKHNESRLGELRQGVIVTVAVLLLSCMALAESETEPAAGGAFEAEFAMWLLGEQEPAMDGMGFEHGPPPPPPHHDREFEHGPPPSHHHGPRLTDDQMDLAIEVLEVVDPEYAKKIQDKPEMARGMMLRRHPRVVRFVMMSERDPEMFGLRLEDMKLNRVSIELAAAYRKAKLAGDEEELNELRGKLSNVVKEHFELREEIRAHELKLLEARIDRLRAELEERRENARKIIRERTAELTGDLSDQW